MEESGRPQAALRDYLGEVDRPVTVLVPYTGEVDSNTLGYRLGDRLVKANNDFISNFTGIPGQLRENWRILSDPEQRRQLARGLIAETGMTTRHRKALLSILLWSSILLYLVVALILGIVNREALGTYQSVWSLFFYSLGTSLFLPIPFEIILQDSVANLGVAWTVLVAAFAKTLGAYLVLLAGDKASAGLETVLAKRPVMRAGFRALMAMARKFGLYFVFFMFVIPFNSDTAPLFLAALLRFKKASFLLVMFAAVVIRSLIFIYAWDAIKALF